jgi:two-component system, NarL family, nitrate/nitrite response regulator NarL
MASHNSPPLPIRIVIADDHPIFRDGLRRLLEVRAEFRVVGSACDGDEALALVADQQPDILLLDLAMPRMSGLATVRELQSRRVRTKIILCTAAIERREIAAALQLGARGVVLKQSASDVLVKAIHAALDGDHWVGRKRVTDLAATLRDLADAAAQPARKQFGLTPRELEIVSVIIGGYSNNDIATRFSISEGTVKHHLTNIFDKLGVSNRLELALFALHHNLEAPLSPVPVGTSAA